MLILLAEAVAAGHAPPTLLGLDAEHWVYVSLTIFLIAMVWFGKAHHRVRDALDAKIAETRRHLDEAKAIRSEAEALLAQAKAKAAASAGDAQAIIDHAEIEAKGLIATAKNDAAQLVTRRQAMAEDKIAAAERGAVAAVRAKAVDVATRAAATIIADVHGAKSDKPLVDRTIAGLGRPN